MITFRPSFAKARLAHTVCQQNARIILVHSVADGRLYADAGSAARYDEVFDLQLLQNGVEVCLIEAAKSMFVDQKVASLWLEFVQYIGVPGVTDQDAAVPAVRRTIAFANTKQLVS